MGKQVTLLRPARWYKFVDSRHAQFWCRMNLETSGNKKCIKVILKIVLKMSKNPLGPMSLCPCWSSPSLLSGSLFLSHLSLSLCVTTVTPRNEMGSSGHHDRCHQLKKGQPSPPPQLFTMTNGARKWSKLCKFAVAVWGKFGHHFYRTKYGFLLHQWDLDIK